MSLQAKVLRAVEGGEVQPLGSNDAPDTVDVRLVCATNRDLPKMAGEGTFREDLYYRLSVVTMELPPLRTYKDDNLQVMAEVFLAQAVERHGREGVRTIAPDALAVLLAYDFPGNVRELKNAVEHAVIMTTGEAIHAVDLPKLVTGSSTLPEHEPTREPTLAEARERWLAPLEARWLRDLLDRHRGNVRSAAKSAGVTAPTLYKLLERRGMSRARQRS